MPEREFTNQCRSCHNEVGSAEHEERCVAKWPEADQRRYFAASNAAANALVCQDCGSSDGEQDPDLLTVRCAACERAQRHTEELKRAAAGLSFDQVPGMPSIGSRPYPRGADPASEASSRSSGTSIDDTCGLATGSKPSAT